MKSVKTFYKDAQKEWDRLDPPLGRIEFASTRKLIDTYFKEGGRIADIGGGPGRYIVELSKRGFHVTLFDLSPENVAFAATKAAEAGLKPNSLLVGDARDLSELGGLGFDGILALGPLYHLTERWEGISFLNAARRLPNPDGILIAAYLNAWGIARTLLSDAPEWFEDGTNLSSLLNGGAFDDAHACSGFTACSWSTPDEAAEEIREAGFTILEEAGAEGFAGGLRNEIEALAQNNPVAFNRAIAFGVHTSRLAQYRRATDHLLLVAKVG